MVLHDVSHGRYLSCTGTWVQVNSVGITLSEWIHTVIWEQTVNRKIICIWNCTRWRWRSSHSFLRWTWFFSKHNLKQTENNRQKIFVSQAHRSHFLYNPRTLTWRLLGNWLFFAGYFGYVKVKRQCLPFFVSHFRSEVNRPWLLSPLVENTLARCRSFALGIVVVEFIENRIARGLLPWEWENKWEFRVSHYGSFAHKAQ